MTNIEKEYRENQDQFMLVGYKDNRPVMEMLQNTTVLAFNLWSFLTKFEPPLDEVRIRYVTDEEAEQWEREAEEEGC